MAEPQAVYTVDLSVYLDKLARLLGANDVILLTRLLEDVQSETGFGNVIITMAVRSGKVIDIQATKSYRSP